jgi:altronate hydrolase
MSIDHKELTTNSVIKIHAGDNVAVAILPLRRHERIRINGRTVSLKQAIQPGHKVAIQEIHANELIIKYGFPIGRATRSIQAGELVHVHNLRSLLEGVQEYAYTPILSSLKQHSRRLTFEGYIRENGQVGIRNEIWIISTVGCVNKVSAYLAAEAGKRFGGMVDGIYSYAHPYGCSQLGDDLIRTQKILAGLVNHPNAAGILVLGLGCENNCVPEFKLHLGKYNPNRVRFLISQDVEDEIQEGLMLLEQLSEYVSAFKRKPCDVSNLIVGLKCGGSDGFSGITANPLLGRFSDRLVEYGGTVILTEVPEMFGAETILMERCMDSKIHTKTVQMINTFKEYYIKHRQESFENASFGNKEGGLSTIEEKSLGCTQKGGTSNVVDVVQYGEHVARPGLNLLSATGNDLVSSTALAAAGVQIILFSTGRGTPFGAPVPTVKIATNTNLFNRKRNWIDYNAGKILDGEKMDLMQDDFFQFVLRVAAGEIRTRNEINGYRDIAIFKDGVTT